MTDVFGHKNRIVSEDWTMTMTDVTERALFGHENRCGFKVHVVEPEEKDIFCDAPKEHSGWHIFLWTVPMTLEIRVSRNPALRPDYSIKRPAFKIRTEQETIL